MNGGVFHEHMVDSLEQSLQAIGCVTQRQVPSRTGRTTGYIDLLATTPNGPLLIEVEMSPRRVPNDLAKRRDLGDTAILWIVVPNARLAHAVHRRLQALGEDGAPNIFVFTFGQAIRRIMAKNQFGFWGVGEENKTKRTTKTSRDQRNTTTGGSPRNNGRIRPGRMHEQQRQEH